MDVYCEQGETFDKDTGPSIEELVGKEGVDKLDYMGWTLDQGANPMQVRFQQMHASCI